MICLTVNLVADDYDIFFFGAASYQFKKQNTISRGNSSNEMSNLHFNFRSPRVCIGEENSKELTTKFTPVGPRINKQAALLKLLISD